MKPEGQLVKVEKLMAVASKSTLAFACMFVLTGAAHAETWSCAVTSASNTPEVRLYRVESGNLRNLSDEKLVKALAGTAAKPSDYTYKVLLNNTEAVIAERDSAAVYDKGQREIFVENIIIDRKTGNYINTTVSIEAQKDSGTVSVRGTCESDQ